MQAGLKTLQPFYCTNGEFLRQRKAWRLSYTGALRRRMLSGMSAEQTYPLSEAIKAQAALRAAANLPPESFPLRSIIGMFSDEIETLRRQGMDDTGIAKLISSQSSIQVDAKTLAELYATPEQRHHQSS